MAESADAEGLLFDDANVDAALELLDRHDATGLLAVPTHLSAINDVQRDAGYDVDDLRYIRTGGSVVSPELVEDTSVFPTENVYNTYGMTGGRPEPLLRPPLRTGGAHRHHRQGVVHVGATGGGVGLAL